jgi:hypothetical protein
MLFALFELNGCRDKAPAELEVSFFLLIVDMAVVMN